MNVVWMVLDSLSFGATPFSETSPDTMPNLKALADSNGVTFTRAYAPGPLSPSSHAAMFTGEYPSTAGMYEAHPYFNENIPTIADSMGQSHRTHLLSLNMWLFQGLDRGFDSTRDFSRQYLVFRDATDPLNYFRKHEPDGSGVSRFLRFATADRKPIRSLVNYANYKRQNGSLVPERWGDSENYQYADKINEQIRSIIGSTGQDVFVFANYMDIHPPFDATDAALEQFAPGMKRDELPIGTSPERHIRNDRKSYDPDAMENLYHSAIWDLDRKLGPTLRELVADDTMVIVTSDHGIWNRDTAYSENRLHVPLVIFAPDEPSRTVDHTVNLRSLPRTIIEHTTGESEGFGGRPLLSVTDDGISVTEILHHPNEIYEETGRVDVTKKEHADNQIQRDLVLIQGDSRVNYIDATWDTVAGTDSATATLKTYGEQILSQNLEQSNVDIEYDAVTQERLEDLGYM